MTERPKPPVSKSPVSRPPAPIRHADAEAELAQLLTIMAALRTPVTGCPWDLEQNFRTIAPYTIEEAYEVVDAVERDDMVDLVDELGDLLLQVVFHARLAEEAGHFDFAAVARAINTKMVRRHPHVFGDGAARDAGMVKAAWAAIKAEEKAEKAARRGDAAQPGTLPADSVLAGVPTALPGLTRAVKLQDKAGTVGFDWNDPRAVIAKIREELAEVEEVLDASDARKNEEVGDLLFVVANLARHLKVDAEGALRDANAKFIRRFRHIETSLAAEGRSLSGASLDEMEGLWQAAKGLEPGRG
ncbi:MAG: nucleoside triphosphate pyrophosphohydrolase [Proteobacteria bacterium]|nr:nucleoside triphosphate pyrophosphohydrolase [Pseudomonadota bacterium]